jgi:hypothetical protein
MKNYQLKSTIYLFKDKKTTKFHVKNDDYFATKAAVLSLIKERIENYRKSDKKLIQEIINNLIKDSCYLQKNYSIKPKNKKIIHQVETKDKGQ